MTTMTVITDEFRAMGCSVDVQLVDGDRQLVELARRRIQHLENCWSRFLPTSDVSRLNAADGSPVQVDPATIVLLETMVAGFVDSGGTFDPTLLVPLVGLGYSSSWTDSSAITVVPSGLAPRGNIVGVAVDRQFSVAQLPDGTAIDAGGIGKGLAADLVAEEMVALGARGAMVSIGGDLRCCGEGPTNGSWLLGVADVVDDTTEAARLAVGSGGVATSGTVRRSWRDARDESVHHLLDPASGRPLAQSGVAVVQATAIAGTAATAEVYTKIVMVLGAVPSLAMLDELGLGARAVLVDGSVLTNEAWSSFAEVPTCTLN